MRDILTFYWLLLCDLLWSLFHLGRKLTFMGYWTRAGITHVAPVKTRALYRREGVIVTQRRTNSGGERVEIPLDNDDVFWCWGWKKEDVEALCAAHALK